MHLEIFNGELTMSGPQYSRPFEFASDRIGGVIISHPAATTTTYGVEFGPLGAEDAWVDSGVEIEEKTAAENFAVQFESPFPRFRIRAETTDGDGGTIGRAWGSSKE
jgi:hypothetical protein